MRYLELTNRILSKQVISLIVVGNMDEESENWDRNLKNPVGDKGSLFTCHCRAF